MIVKYYATAHRRMEACLPLVDTRRYEGNAKSSIVGLFSTGDGMKLILFAAAALRRGGACARCRKAKLVRRRFIVVMRSES